MIKYYIIQKRFCLKFLFLCHLDNFIFVVSPLRMRTGQFPPGQLSPRTFAAYDNCPQGNYPQTIAPPLTIPTLENCSQIIAPGQFPPMIIDPQNK